MTHITSTRIQGEDSRDGHLTQYQTDFHDEREQPRNISNASKDGGILRRGSTLLWLMNLAAGLRRDSLVSSLREGGEWQMQLTRAVTISVILQQGWEAVSQLSSNQAPCTG